MAKFIMARKFSDKQNKERLSLLKLDTDDKFGGVNHFENLSSDTLQTLVDKGYADLDDKQNDAPTLGEFLSFMKQYPEFTAHGYVVSNDRNDRRISIEGLEGNTTDEHVIEAFKELSEYADELDCENGHCRCWFD